ncbi:MAG TPA: hypothetical protein VFA70_11465 [Dehalococcoidia bacterium]|jgi:hypothetical protein|nr:hypothetical protein [Dehalococcoidia bacterium]
MPSFFRRLTDAFLRAVTPPRRDERLPRAGWWLEADALLVGRRRDALPVDEARRLGYWPGQEERPDFVRAWRDGVREELERPWNFRWDRLPKHSAGPGFSADDYEAARERGQQIARATLGEELWALLQRQGYLDVPSKRYPGMTYRLRVGRRIQVICAPGVEPPWYFDFLCINPVYPLPEYEFFAQLYLYVRDQEEEVVRVAAPQPWDQALGRTF